ncbi:MAG TPA: EAL domain-containing response regulator, partial [Polyangiaceae bacterium LLY-WYZ-14_1]|nr:EAL domain-containing response regulator [Polyangiaceae bacterium LLY-WYZ-14_1]
MDTGPSGSSVDGDAKPSRGRVLLVDDEPALVKAYRRVLTGHGYEVDTASDGDQAISLFQRGGVDVVMTDITMPGMDGMELLRAIRRADPDVPIVLATGGPTLETAVEALEHGVLKYLVKPVDPKDLIRVMDRAVQLHRLGEVKRQLLAHLTKTSEFESDLEQLEAAFERALTGLFLHFQPIVWWSRRQVFGYEALVRTNEAHLPHPGKLFEAAERLDRVRDVGRRIREVAARAVLPDDTSWLFLNLHPQELSDPQLIARSAPLQPMAERVVLEVTERASIAEVPDARTHIAALRRSGFRIAVDDLGAGYSGLSSFALLEPEVAKLDMGLVRDVQLYPTKQRLIRSMCNLCREMGMPLIAEGVETEDERDVLLGLGVD